MIAIAVRFEIFKSRHWVGRTRDEVIRGVEEEENHAKAVSQATLRIVRLV